jgi:hypothetical protein
VLLAAFVIGFSAWSGAVTLGLIVALVTMAVGYVLVNRGVSRMRRISAAPRETIQSLKETAAWTKGA